MSRVIVRIDELRIPASDPAAVEQWLRRCAAVVFDGVRESPTSWTVERVLSEALAAPIEESR